MNFEKAYNELITKIVETINASPLPLMAKAWALQSVNTEIGRMIQASINQPENKE